LPVRRYSHVLDLVNDPDEDVRITPNGQLLEFSSAPQLILSDFSFSKSQPSPAGSFAVSVDEVAGTASMAHYASPKHIEYTITVSSVGTLGAVAMVEALMQREKTNPQLEVAYGSGADAFTMKFLKQLTREWTERPADSVAALTVYDCRERICDVPVYDGWSEVIGIVQCAEYGIYSGAPVNDDEAEAIAEVSGNLLGQAAVDA
jgi:hypothetical protein